MSTRVVHIASANAAAIIAAAHARFPVECCGLLEGTASADGWTVSAVHETGNVADDPRKHFLIDPEFQIALLRRLRGTGCSVIGCFHSHPRGRAEPSASDLSHAIEQDFLWLIAAGDPGGFVLRGYRFTGDGFEPVELQQPK